MAGLRVLLGESEVSDDGAAIAHEDIGQLEIAMQVAPFGHFDETSDDVLHDLEDFLLGDPPALLEEAGEVALVAVLRDDVTVGGLTDHVVTLQDVGVFNLGQRLDLAV
jgi:hypothetical protein